jgi:hypothetical protein
MAQYKMIFDTTAGEQEFKLTLREDECLAEVFDPLMDELMRKGGGPLRGDGPPQVIHKNRVLDMGQPFPGQGVEDGEVLRVTCYFRNG